MGHDFTLVNDGFDKVLLRNDSDFQQYLPFKNVGTPFRKPQNYSEKYHSTQHIVWVASMACHAKNNSGMMGYEQYYS